MDCHEDFLNSCGSAMDGNTAAMPWCNVYCKDRGYFLRFIVLCCWQNESERQLIWADNYLEVLAIADKNARFLCSSEMKTYN